MLNVLHHAASLYHNISHVHNTFLDAHDEMTASNVYQLAVETVEALRVKLPEHLTHPRVAIVCGSGLSGLAETVNKEVDAEGKEVKYELAYKDVPNFPISTVAGHEGRLIFSTIGEQRVPVVLFVGRAHFYEGYDMPLVTFATRVCSVLGCNTMLLTNAAGGLNPEYNVGDIVCLNDHLNLAGLVGFHPLRGPNAEDFGVRFPPLSDAYDLALRRKAFKAWSDLRAQTPAQRRMHEGVYAFCAGPSYETRAEARMLQRLGADVVGMSTVPEIIVARHSGMRVLAFSLVTNNVVLESTARVDDPKVASLSDEELEAYMSRGRANHEEVLEAGRAAAIDMQGLVLRIVSEL